MKKRIITSLILHSLILVMTVLAVLMRFGGLRFFGPNSSPSDWTNLRYFTVESNLFVGLVSPLFIVYDVLYLTGKITKRPTWVDCIEFIGASCLALTMMTVVLVLGPASAIVNQDIQAFFKLYHNHNLFFHFLTPIASIAAFLINSDGKLSNRFILVGMAPALAYEVFYSIVALSHMDSSGKPPFEYDWYGFLQGGIGFGVLAVIGMAGLSALLSFLLLFFSRKIAKRFN